VVALKEREVAMKKVLAFLALGFALFAAPAAIIYPHDHPGLLNQNS
jgi:hypothetical protein